MSVVKQEFTGKVITQMFAKGSKSEHEAVQIEIANKLFVLRLKGENPFNSTKLKAFIGKKVIVKGYIQDYTFFAETILELK